MHVWRGHMHVWGGHMHVWGGVTCMCGEVTCTCGEVTRCSCFVFIIKLSLPPPPLLPHLSLLQPVHEVLLTPLTSRNAKSSGTTLGFKPPSTDSSDYCHFCSKRVYLMERMSANGFFFHRSCFRWEEWELTMF